MSAAKRQADLFDIAITDVAAPTLCEVLVLTRKGPGWQHQVLPPQRIPLDGGAELIVVVPALWRGRGRAQARKQLLQAPVMARAG